MFKIMQTKIQYNYPYDYDETCDNYSAAILFIVYLNKTSVEDFIETVIEAREQILPQALEGDNNLQAVVRCFKQ